MIKELIKKDEAIFLTKTKITIDVQRHDLSLLEKVKKQALNTRKIDA